MDTRTFIENLQKNGVSLWVDKNTLRYKGPKEVLTPEIVQTLKAKKQEIINEKSQPTRARGYGCAGCGNTIYQAVQAWQTTEMSGTSPWKHEHRPVIHWRCEGCGAVFQFIGGTKGPQTIT